MNKISISRSLMAAALLGQIVMLSACAEKKSKKSDIAALDEKLAGKGSDPAMNAAVEDRILVDPALADGANTNMVKAADEPLNGAVPPDTGYDGAVPGKAEVGGALKTAPKPKIVKGRGKDAATLESIAAAQRNAGLNGCAASLQYGAAWSAKMPSEFGVYPKARVTDAGGSDSGGCGLRAVSFNTASSMQSVADYYYSRASQAGFSAEYQTDGAENMLGGTRDRDGRAFLVILKPGVGGGTAVDIVANTGS